MRCFAIIAALLGALGCGTPPNQHIIARTTDYHKALSLVSSTGYPIDIAELERKVPELKGIVISAPQWIAEYEDLVRRAKEKGEAVFEYRLQGGSNISIEVMGEPTLTRSLTVPPMGSIQFPLLGKLIVTGLTADELKQTLEEKLRVYLKKPEVIVTLNLSPSFVFNPTQPFAQPAFGGGEIILLGAASSRYFSNISFTGKETLLNVLGPGGLSASAEWRQIRVIRRDPRDPLHKARVIVCDLWDYIAKADVRQDIPLWPGDVVYVPYRWSSEEQMWEDWNYMKRIVNEVFFVDSLKESIKKGGSLRD